MYFWVYFAVEDQLGEAVGGGEGGLAKFFTTFPLDAHTASRVRCAV